MSFKWSYPLCFFADLIIIMEGGAKIRYMIIIDNVPKLKVPVAPWLLGPWLMPLLIQIVNTTITDPCLYDSKGADAGGANQILKS